MNYPSATSAYSVRHAYSFTAVNATGIRLTVPGNGLSTGACVDELEASVDRIEPAFVHYTARSSQLQGLLRIDPRLRYARDGHGTVVADKSFETLATLHSERTETGTRCQSSWAPGP